MFTALCGDKMGLENGLLNDQQIQVSSILDDNDLMYGPRNIRVNGPFAWRPSNNEINEWVMVSVSITFFILADN